jgi:inhibitor of cysteine peptidase
MPGITLTKADAGRTVELSQGATAEIELEENPTTGYRWTLEESLPAGIGVVGDEYTPGGSAVGAGGLRRFSLRADAPGGGVVSLKLWREWTGESSVIDRFHVTVRIAG